MVCKMVPGDNTPAVSSDSGDEIRMAMIVVQDMTSATSQVGRITVQLASTALVQKLFHDIRRSSKSQVAFELLLQRPSNTDETVVLNEHLNKTLEAAGFVCDNGFTRNNVIIVDKRAAKDVSSPVSGSPIGEGSNQAIALPVPGTSYSTSRPDADDEQGRGKVGLVNQAMTCYLNSLIQTLFMTPEFRNALYRWRFDGTDEEQAKSIPFQLQSLFLKLQTTDKPSIGTTNLTRSFGWDSSEAWQQHDIQELCRVMFDALEHKFRNTEQSDLISRLYEGKMMDYVRCLECRTEKAREDTFLDIPLPVRPFGSQTAYGSIEEALKAFVAPETLDGNNQYLCDVCTKKCDAHKGLKFSRFPYLLTLHLKRFDFDYTTLHRIKLNDKVTFPEFLHLDSFLISNGNEPNNSANQPGAGGLVKDSQDTAIEDSMSEASESSRANSSNDAESQDDDEGIDVRTESCASGASAAGDHHHNRKNTHTSRGQYSYELFSIMIHSGSASGGHYYAYIKDFSTGEWFCFNDQTVSSITQEDIRKTYGGGPTRSSGYFSSAYASSTNAYMLMYRQVNKERNANFIRPAEFPEHIQHLLQRFKEEEETARVAEEQERNTCRVSLYCHHPKRGMVDLSFKIPKETTLREAVSLAYEQIGDLSEAGVTLDRCRLVKYSHYNDNIECSWETKMNEPIDNIFYDGVTSVLLEILEVGRAFEVIRPNSIVVRVVMMDIETGDMGAPVSIRLSANSTASDLKHSIISTLNLDELPEHIHMVTARYSEVQRIVACEKSLRSSYNFNQRSERVYATVFRSTEDDEFRQSCKPRFYPLIDQFEHAVQVRFTVPHFDQETLDRLGIPSSPTSIALSPTCMSQSPAVVSRPADSPVMMEEDSYSREDAASDDSLSNLERERALSEGEEEEEENRRRRQEDIEQFAAGSAHFRGEFDGVDDLGVQLPNSASSASEDSSHSLTDSDRTLLGDRDPPDMEEAFICDEGQPQLPQADDGDRGAMGLSGQPYRRNALVVDEEPSRETKMASMSDVADFTPLKYIFKVLSCSESEGEKNFTAFVDKRIPVSAFKTELQSLLNVPAEHIILYKKSPSQSVTGISEREWSNAGDTLESLGEEPSIVVRLGKALKPGDSRGKVFQVNVQGVAPGEERIRYLFEWVMGNGVNVGCLKREILAELKSRLGVELSPEKCILRKKSWKTPGALVGDDDTVIDAETAFYKNWEIFLQPLDPDRADDVAANYRDGDFAIFTRRWRPSTLALEDFVNVRLSVLNRTELGHVLSAESGLTPDNIEIAKAPGSFPHEGSILSIHDEITWVPLVEGDTEVGEPAEFKYPVNITVDGEVVYWRDKNEPLKKLTDQERREILRRENGHGESAAGPSSSYSSRRERPLRIFLDSPSVSKSELTPELD